MSDIQNWLLNPPKWTTKHSDLIKFKTYVKNSVNLDEIIRNCDNILEKPDFKTTCCKFLLDIVPKDVLERNIQSAYPVMHEAALHLCAEFILTKLNHGSSIEKRIYENMTLLEFIQRLLEKRPVYIANPGDDYYKLRDGTTAVADHGPWENIGTEKERKPLVLEDYLSYDEMKLSALLSISSYSYFVNSGRRCNRGDIDPRETVQDEGVVIGLIGPRLCTRDKMETQEIFIGKQSMLQTILSYFNFKKPSVVLDLFLNFYQEKTHFQDTSQRYLDLPDGRFFDSAVYSKRLAISFDTLLIEANHRAQEKGKSAYVHVVHIELYLSVHDIYEQQAVIFLNTFGQRIKALGKNLKFISDVEFSYFDQDGSCLGYGNDSIFPIENHPQGGIQIHFTRRPPFEKIDHKDVLVVVSYATDSNSMPGKESWITDGFYDTPTVSACQLSELHNPYINPIVAGENLRVATPTGLVPVQEYLQNVLDNLSQQQTAGTD